MDTKLFARIAAGAFVAVALTMTVLTLREEREVVQSEVVTIQEPDSDPLPGRLKACAAMGELALSAPDCRAAWAEQRQRFLGIEPGEAPSAAEPEQSPSDIPPAVEQ
jgi:conjugative transfer region protein TrbK